jgi:hypothetical protein
LSLTQTEKKRKMTSQPSNQIPSNPKFQGKHIPLTHSTTLVHHHQTPSTPQRRRRPLSPTTPLHFLRTDPKDDHDGVRFQTGGDGGVDDDGTVDDDGDPSTDADAETGIEIGVSSVVVVDVGVVDDADADASSSSSLSIVSSSCSFSSGIEASVDRV